MAVDAGRGARRGAGPMGAADFIALLRADPVGSAWLAALAWGEREALLELPAVQALLDAALKTARLAIDRDLAPQVRAQAAWACIELAMQRQTAAVVASAAAPDDDRALLHVTTFQIMADWHFEGLQDAATATLAVRAVTDGSERKRHLRRLLRQMRDEGSLRLKPGARLGIGRLWMSRHALRRPNGGGDLASLARDAFGLVHRSVADFLVLYAWPADTIAPVTHRRPHALDCPGRRFRAWTDTPVGGVRWGTAVHLALLARQAVHIDGAPETVTAPCQLADSGPFHVLLLGHPGARGREAVPVRGRQPTDNDTAFALRVEHEAQQLGLAIDALSHRLGETRA